MCHNLLCIIALSKPSMQKLCRYVVNKVASMWEFLGYALLDENQSAQIENIKTNDKDNEKCCVEMFNWWLRTHPNINWHDLVKALNTANLQTVAADLEKMFIGMYGSITHTLYLSLLKMVDQMTIP